MSRPLYFRGLTPQYAFKKGSGGLRAHSGRFGGRAKVLPTTENRTRIPHSSSPHTRHYIGFAMKAYIKNLITVIICICSEYTILLTNISYILQDVYITNNTQSLPVKLVYIFPRRQSAASQVLKAMYNSMYFGTWECCRAMRPFWLKVVGKIFGLDFSVSWAVNFVVY